MSHGLGGWVVVVDVIFGFFVVVVVVVVGFFVVVVVVDICEDFFVVVDVVARFNGSDPLGLFTVPT